MSDAPTGEHDPLTTRVYDVLDQVIETQQAMRMLAEAIRDNRGGQTQTVVHQHKGMGAWGGAAVTACFMTFLALVLFAGEVRTSEKAIRDDVRDLKAWQQVHQARISALESKEKVK